MDYSEENIEIKYAQKAHNSLLKYRSPCTPPILKKPERQIIHNLKDVDFDFTKKGFPPGYPGISDKEEKLRERWRKCPDHFLLWESINSGIIPTAWQEKWDYNRGISHTTAMREAKDIGYEIPDRITEGYAPPSHSESEALQAAYMIISGNFCSWSSYGDFCFENQNAHLERYRAFRQSLCQLSCQFIVPRDESKEFPYVLDQLWIHSPSPNNYRFIVLEIDGEQHFQKEKKNADKRRDELLEDMGYEVYRIAGWWCRIDPYRAILEFLDASNMFLEGHKFLLGGNLTNIEDYICDHCDRPMVRWDEDWISRIDDQLTKVHLCCLRQLLRL